MTERIAALIVAVEMETASIQFWRFDRTDQGKIADVREFLKDTVNRG